MQILSLCCVKLSFVMFYRRIFCTGQRTLFSIATVTVSVLIVLWTIIFFFLFVFYCGTNTWAEWTNVIDLEEYCPHGTDYQMGLAISDFIIDLIVIAMPIPLVRAASFT